MENQAGKRIAKNTALLYFRMILIMLVSLYTVRVVLQVLGVKDYGIYNVVAGIVVMFSFLSGTMASATQRFFAFELGKNDFEQLKKIFSISLIMFAFISLIILFFAETVGLWFVNHKLIIPAERLKAANWIYQISIFSFVLTIITLPYNSSIIAHEDMGIYAYISILEAILKLVIVFLLSLFSIDKLILYGFLLLCSNFVITLVYRTICKKKYQECHFVFYWNKNTFKAIGSYAGWNMIGAIANISKYQGANILLNLFFGPVINAAMGLAIQVNTVINSFVTNFYMAVRPHITKVYAKGDKEYMMQLVFSSAKLSYFLLLLLSMPLLIETDYILNLWLKVAPDYLVIFIRLLLISILIEAMNNQLVAAIQATGKIKTYQITISIIVLFIFPISYIFLRFNFLPYIVLYVLIAIDLVCFVPQLLIAHKIVGLPVYDYLKRVIFISIIVTLIASITPLLFYFKLQPGTMRFFAVVVSGLFSCMLSIYYIGLTSREKNICAGYIKNKLYSNKN